MLDSYSGKDFTEIIISTPGRSGLTALLAAKMTHLQNEAAFTIRISRHTSGF